MTLRPLFSLLLCAFVLACDASSLLLPHNSVDMEQVERHIRTLADDSFDGRAPATPGGDKTEAYLIAEMRRAGLKPGNGESYRQAVPMLEINLETAASSLRVYDGAQDYPMAYRQDVVYGTKRVAESIEVAGSDLVFVGYGIVAPEYGWDDYAGIDVKGKTVVMLVNDPGFATQDPKLFNGKTMTYYGRWTYKYEEASRQGAAAAMIIHQSAPASYGWGVVETSWSGPQLDLERADGNAGRVALEGWFTEEKSRELFEAAGLDFDALTAAAAQPGFEAVDMGDLKLDASLKSTLRPGTSNNIVGVVEGAVRPDEYILYMAHWDHLGHLEEEGLEDPIYNGAVDNATGTAAILAIGEAFAKAQTPPDRSVMILAVTAEESGLLGSGYFAEDPLAPLANIVGGINLDAILPAGPARNLTVIGLGSSQLEDVLASYASLEDVVLERESTPEAGFFYRSDHISLAKKGVPMLYVDAGDDLIDGGKEAGAAIGNHYITNAYHKPSDEYNSDWQMGSIEQVTRYAYQMGNALARSDSWPNWYDGNEFRALRDEMRGGK